MSILGLTLDYGPFGFLDMYDPNHVCNGSDEGGRYSFQRQPEICLWNLRKFAEAIEKALPLSISLPLLVSYKDYFYDCYWNKMRSKLGLIDLDLVDDKDLIEDFYNTMQTTGADFTNTFCCFLFADASDFNNFQQSIEVVEENILKQCYPVEVLIKSCKQSLSSEQLQRLNSIPETLEDLGEVGETIRRLKANSERKSKLEQMTPESKMENDRILWRNWLEKYQLRVSKEMESNSDKLADYNRRRLDIMGQNNPRFILRNYIAENAIQKAEQGDYSEVKRVLKLLESPYDHSVLESLSNSSIENANLKYDDSGPSTSFSTNTSKKEDSKNDATKYLYNKSPDWAFSLKVT